MIDWRIAAGAATVVGIAFGIWIGGRFDDEEPRPTAPTAKAEIATGEPSRGADAATRAELDSVSDALRDALAVERRERILLAAQLDDLREEIGASTAPPVPSAGAQERQSASQESPPWFDVEALIQAGRPAEQAEVLRARFEQAELDELYVRDTATREGWAGSPRLRRELTAIRDQLREELGEKDYDWLLYASGRENRVRIQAVLQDSPAAEAGVLTGDVILRYDGNRILSPQELKRATTGGRVGETIAVDVARGSEQLRVYVPRGPLGTRLGRTRRPPEEP